MATPGAAPARLGRYELIARLAAGGMGEIFLARLEGAAGFEKLFVIKRILPHLADEARFRTMLIAEARIASMMAHANICQVYELGETDGQLYIVMEYLEGITLLPLLRKRSRDGGALELGFIAGVIQQATDALHYAHELKGRGGDTLGIVHRDVTPTNLFLTDAGVVKVLDFGIAKVKDASAHTQTGTVKGKYAYMAPEQLRGAAAVDRRVDVFALGVVLYEMLALRRLFQRKTDYLTFRAVMEHPILDVRRYRPDCPDALVAALTRALDRDPALRFDTARQFGSAVLDAITGVTRPWTQGELGDHVRLHFADDIAQRSAQIASAARTSGGRAAMPLITQSEDTAEVEDDAEEIPTVDAETSETPVEVRHLRGPTSERVAVAEPSDPGPHLDALRATAGMAAQPPPPIVVVNQKRSMLWPLLAIAMVAIAGGALFLVWSQMQIQQQRPSLVISHDQHTEVAEGGSNTVIVGHRAAPSAPDPGTGSLAERARSGSGEQAASGDGSDGSAGSAGSAPGSEREVHRDPQRGSSERQPSMNSKDRAAVDVMQPGMSRCATQHGNPPLGTRLVIVVGPDGHPKRVTIEPPSVDAGPLGTCIRKVVRTGKFPRGDQDRELEVKLVRPA